MPRQLPNIMAFRITKEMSNAEKQGHIALAKRYFRTSSATFSPLTHQILNNAFMFARNTFIRNSLLVSECNDDTLYKQYSDLVQLAALLDEKCFYQHCTTDAASYILTMAERELANHALSHLHRKDAEAVLYLTAGALALLTVIFSAVSFIDTSSDAKQTTNTRTSLPLLLTVSALTAIFTAANINNIIDKHSRKRYEDYIQQFRKGYRVAQDSEVTPQALMKRITNVITHSCNTAYASVRSFSLFNRAARIKEAGNNEQLALSNHAHAR